MKTIFLDRDGVINKKAKPHEYINKWYDFEFIQGSIEAVRILNKLEYRIVVVTNQRGIARDLITCAEIDNIHENMLAQLETQGAHIDAIYVCPHEEGACNCRKPEIGLFLLAEQELSIDKSQSYMIGDSKSDILAGNRYGIKTIMLGYSEIADYCCEDLLAAAKMITQIERNFR